MKYLSILFISNPVLAANNRGENEGTLQTLQKINTRTGTRTVLNGASIRRAIRDVMQASGAKMWRRTVQTPDIPAGYVYGDNDSPSMDGAVPPTPAGYADEIFGWMVATKDSKEYANRQTSAIAVTAAISTTPYDGDTAFLQGLKAKESSLNPFQVERHWTRYQFMITINLADAGDKVPQVLDALKGLQVGGNHTANLTELTPDTLIWRFHDVPGQSGLYLGAGVDFSPDEPVNIDPIRTRAENLGFCFWADKNIVRALDQIKESLP